MFEIRYTLFRLLPTREPWPSLAYQKGFLVVVGVGPVKYLVHQGLSLAAKTGSFPILLRGHASQVHQSRRAARVSHLWTRRFHPTKHCFGVLCRTAFHSTPGPGICTNTPSLIIAKVVGVRLHILLGGLSECDRCGPRESGPPLRRRFPAKHHTVPLFNRMDARRMSLSTLSGICCFF